MYQKFGLRQVKKHTSRPKGGHKDTKTIKKEQRTTCCKKIRLNKTGTKITQVYPLITLEIKI